MAVKMNIDAGICSFQTVVRVASEDYQHVTFDIQRDCGKVRAVAELLKRQGAIDAFQEISPNAQSIVLSTAFGVLKGCCAACVVPVGIFKGMQVAAGLALPKDMHITVVKE
jgi:hypothetical protein